MKKAPQPKEDAPRLVVAVPSLTPTYGLLCLQPVEGFQQGIIYKVYGGNLNAQSLYLEPVPENAIISKYRRIAADFEEYEHELLDPKEPLPSNITEMIPAEYPGCFQLVITDANVIPAPVVAAERLGCKVIQHPAAPAAYDLAEAMYKQKQLKKLKAKAAKNKDPHTLFLFPELEPLTRTA